MAAISADISTEDRAIALAGVFGPLIGLIFILGFAYMTAISAHKNGRESQTSKPLHTSTTNNKSITF